MSNQPARADYGQVSTADDVEGGVELRGLADEDKDEDEDTNALLEELQLREFRMTWCGIDFSKDNRWGHRGQRGQ